MNEDARLDLWMEERLTPDEPWGEDVYSTPDDYDDPDEEI